MHYLEFSKRYLGLFHAIHKVLGSPSEINIDYTWISSAEILDGHGSWNICVFNSSCRYFNYINIFSIYI